MFTDKAASFGMLSRCGRLSCSRCRTPCCLATCSSPSCGRPSCSVGSTCLYAVLTATCTVLSCALSPCSSSSTSLCPASAFSSLFAPSYMLITRLSTCCCLSCFVRHGEHPLGWRQIPANPSTIVCCFSARCISQLLAARCSCRTGPVSVRFASSCP